MDYASRRGRIYDWMQAERIDAAYLTSDADIRYLTGMPNDSVLLLFANEKSTLVPWDIHLAQELANADEIVPYTSFDRNLDKTLGSLFVEAGIGGGMRIEAPEATAFPTAARLSAVLEPAEFICRTDGLDAKIRELRAVKDEDEIALIIRAASIANDILETLIDNLESGFQDETEVAHFIEAEAISSGAESVGFPTIVAGHDRSHGIHAFPGYGVAPIGSAGFTIIDFGVRVGGYTSDATLAALFGDPTQSQRKMLNLVQEAYDMSIDRLAPGVDARSIAGEVESLFGSAGYSMPHSLGHGIGLEVHEAPWLRSAGGEPSPLEPGMVFTIEPGLYDPTEGGVRLENDVVIASSGVTIITNSRIVQFPDSR
jgi:Xaa-Pro dipeptidase